MVFTVTVDGVGEVLRVRETEPGRFEVSRRNRRNDWVNTGRTYSAMGVMTVIRASYEARPEIPAWERKYQRTLDRAAEE